jgi:hypothetical protein
MIDELLELGDNISVTIGNESREWGYNPCLDGTKATVLGFSEITYGRIGSCGLKPGVYVNRSWPRIRLESGHEYTEWTGRLELCDQNEYGRRLAEFRKRQAENLDDFRTDEFLRDLPETPFWEGDFVRVNRRLAVSVVYDNMPPKQDPETFQVIGIDYGKLDSKTVAGLKYPAYNISDKIGGGWHTSVSEDEMELAERGPIWKYYHNEPIRFSGLAEEAAFFGLIGETKEVRNPACGLYRWTKEEVLDAIKAGLVHGFSLNRGFFGGAVSIRAIRFENEELGKRVAKATLEGFNMS